MHVVLGCGFSEPTIPKYLKESSEKRFFKKAESHEIKAYIDAYSIVVEDHEDTVLMLKDGEIIRGQNEISHPATGAVQTVNKDCSSTIALPSRIKRVFYMSSEGSNLLHEIFPEANSTVLEQLSTVDCIVYSMGSLFTSICPSLILPGIGEIIASRSIPKVLLLNGSHDRETTGLCASDFVTAITDALNRTYGDPHKCLTNFPSDYINALLVPKDGEVPVDVECLGAQGIFNVIMVDSIQDPKVGTVFEPSSLIKALVILICEEAMAKSSSY